MLTMNLPHGRRLVGLCPERPYHAQRGATGGLSASVSEALAASSQWHPACGHQSTFLGTALGLACVLAIACAAYAEAPAAPVAAPAPGAVGAETHRAEGESAAPAAAPAKAEGPGQPAEAPLEWGPPASGLAAAIALEGEATVGGKLAVRLALRSAAGQTIGLPPAASAFGWIVIVQTLGDARKSVYSGKVPMASAGAAWPAEIKAGDVLRLGPFDLSAAKAYPGKVARQLLTAYVSGDDSVMPEAGGTVSKAIEAGRAVAKFILCLPREGEKPTLVTSGALEIDVGPPDLGSLEAKARQAYLDGLLKQFDRNPWAGQQAHDTCVRLGSEVLERVIAAAFETSRPGPARLWLATTLADIRDPRAVDALVRLLDDPDAGVTYVVAYHGVKQQSPKLDQAVVAKVKAAPADSMLAAWALLGFMVHRGSVPDDVLAAGIESPDPRARTTVAEALAQHASDYNLQRLAGLLADTNERVRGTAAAMLGQSKAARPAVIEALVKALDLPGDSARQRIAKALSDLTGRSGPYDPKADPAARDKAVADWKAWWAAQRAGPAAGEK